jgi:hypothetical protein
LSTYFRHQRVSIIKNTEMHKYISW